MCWYSWGNALMKKYKEFRFLGFTMLPLLVALVLGLATGYLTYLAGY